MNIDRAITWYAFQILSYNYHSFPFILLVRKRQRMRTVLKPGTGSRRPAIAQKK